MTGKARKNFIEKLTRDHDECRQTFCNGSEGERDIAWGQMLGLEAAAFYAGMETLNRELAELRRRDCRLEYI